MRNFFKNVLANIVAILVIGMVFFGFFMLALVGSAMSGGSVASVKNNSVLALDLANVIESEAESDAGFSFSMKEKNETVLYDVINAIKAAKTDDKIKGISIESQFASVGITQLDDIRAALEDFKKSGKFVYAYSNAATLPDYYLGSVADRYFLHPAGGVELHGLSSEAYYVKDFAEKYGIDVQVIRHGKYKAAVEMFLRQDISPENKEQLQTLLDDVWGNMSPKMYNSRKISAKNFKTATDSLFGFIPELALKNKLVDELKQKSEYEDFLKTKLKIAKDKDLNKISISDYISNVKENSGSEKEKIAVLYASGEIYNGSGSGGIYSEDFIKEIKKLAKDEKIKAVVLRINSPGGSGNASDEILFELQKLKAQKPLVVSFGDYAASGGYYIAMAADKIYNEPNTLTGSIGVFGIVPNIKPLAERNGIRSDIVQTNENAAFYTPLHGLSGGTVFIMTQSVESFYKRFVGFVMKNRKKTFQQIDEIGGGRVWSGVHAKELGLVDELGSLDDAVKFAAEKAKLKKYSVSSYPASIPAFEKFMKQFGGSISESLVESKIGKENYSLFKMMTEPNLQNSIQMSTPFRIKL